MALLFLALLLPFAHGGGTSTNVGANVFVGCPIYLSENALTLYAIGNGIVLNYTTNTQTTCSIPSPTGTFTLEYSANSVAVLSNSIFPNAITQTPALYNVPTINSLALTPDNYNAIVDISGSGSSNESSRVFTLVYPVNITVVSFGASPGSVSQGSPITFTMNILNNGQLASGTIGVNIVITGAAGYTITQSANALTPGQSEVLSLMSSGVTGTVGSYTANAFATFVTNGAPAQSNTKSSGYSVTSTVSPSSSSGGPPPPPSTVSVSVSTNATTGPVAVVTVPVSSLPAAPAGLAGLAAFNISSTGSTKALVNITIQYSCNLNPASLQPYLLQNNAWVQISPFSINKNRCTMSFIVQDAIVALMQNPALAVAPLPTSPINIIPQLSFTELPFYTQLVLGTGQVTSLGLKNIVGAPETINLTVPGSFARILSLSAGSVYLPPNESVDVHLLFRTNSTQPSGTYIVPLTISLRIGSGLPVNTTEYFTYIVSGSSLNVSIYSQIYTTPGNATVSLTLVGAQNSTLTNATLITMLPGAVVSNALQIKTYGLPSSIAVVNGTPEIDWLVPFLPSGRGVSFSYTIAKPTNVNLLTTVQNLLVQPSAPAPQSILRVVNVQAPTFYTNSTNRITVGVLYTGTTYQQVAFELTTPGTATILNPVQVVNASPNQLLTQEFGVKTGGATGTLLFNLRIAAQGASLNYSLPVVVLQKTSQSITMPQISVSGEDLLKYSALAIGLVVLAVITIMASRLRRRSRYSGEQAKELIRVREQIKRSDENA